MLDLHAVILEDLEHIVSQPVSWDKLQGKTVLVTGASGMIASYLVFTPAVFERHTTSEYSSVGARA